MLSVFLYLLGDRNEVEGVDRNGWVAKKRLESTVRASCRGSKTTLLLVVVVVILLVVVILVVNPLVVGVVVGVVVVVVILVVILVVVVARRSFLEHFGRFHLASGCKGASWKDEHFIIVDLRRF